MPQVSSDRRRALRDFYNRLGDWEDRLGAYKNPAVRELIAHARMGEARALCEFGHGPGRLAAELFGSHLPAEASYLGIDFSRTMSELAQARLAPFGDRVRLVLGTGAIEIPAAAARFDRFIATYVFDLLDQSDSRQLIAEAHRVLAAGGLLCTLNLTFGRSTASRVVSAVWTSIANRFPVAVGGCRPIRFADRLAPERWRIEHHSVVSRFGVASEITVAAKIGTG